MNGNSATKAALWVIAVFVLGSALGGVLGFMFARHSVAASTNAPQLTEQQRRARRVEQLTHDLGLTDEQSHQLDGILAQVHAQYKAIHEQSDAQFDQARQKARASIRAILTPEQQPKFQEFLRRMDEERKRNASPSTR